MPRLCFVSMVKNESKIIERCLQAVRPYIDYWVILDTGSTDDTKEIIKNTLSDIPGELHECPFVNFETTRTHLMGLAKGKADYLLLCDADEEYIFSDDFDSSTLTKDQYLIQHLGSLDYRVAKLLKGNLPWYFKGVTHEHVACRVPIKSEKINTLFIKDHGDGGCKSDKFKRDIKLLSLGLEREPNNARYMFYLGESYRNSGHFKSAISWYSNRIKAGGWHEEVTCAYERLGMCYESLRDYDKAFAAWMQGYYFNPRRAECVYRAAKLTREVKQDNVAAYHLALIAKKIPYPKDDILFIRKDIYEYLIDYELSITAYYNNDSLLDIPELFRNLVASYPTLYHNIIANYKFYAPQITQLEHKSVDLDNIVGRVEDYNNSSPSIVKLPDGGYLLNVRRVSYRLTNNGEYRTVGKSKAFNTLNTLVKLDKNFKPTTDIKTIYPDDLDQRPVTGLEDLRLFYKDSGELMYTANIWEDYGKVTLVHGAVNLDDLSLSEPTKLKSPTNSKCEKNWLAFNSDQYCNSAVYSFDKMQVIDLHSGSLKILDPKCNLKNARGSCPGQVIGDEIYFLVHFVEYANPRSYYHAFVVVDKNTMKYKTHSKLFKFGNSKIEFCLNFIVEDNQILFTYSSWDRDSNLKIFNKSELFSYLGLRQGLGVTSPKPVKKEKGQQCTFNPTTGIKEFSSPSICDRAFRLQTEAAKVGAAPPVIKRISPTSYQTAVADTSLFKKHFKNIHTYVHDVFPDLVEKLKPIFEKEGDPKHPFKVDITPTNLGIYEGNVVLVDFG